MKIKSLLLGSAAALVAVSGARAADAVVIPEPEAVEYVRVCTAAGAGYFYIPGGETCLKIGGYVQYEIGFEEGDDEFNKTTEARLQFDSWTDSDYGPVTTQIRMTSAITGSDSSNDWAVDRATLSIGGLSMGLMGSLYDFSATGAADTFVDNGVTGNSIQYMADFGSGTFAIQLREDENGNYVPDVVVKGTYTAGDLALAAAVAYNESAENWSAKATVGYAGFGAVVQYTSGSFGSDYLADYEWVLGANYGFDATDKLNLNLGVAYGINEFGGTDNDWAIGAEAKYALTETFEVSARARWIEDDEWDARLRFKASF